MRNLKSATEERKIANSPFHRLYPSELPASIVNSRIYVCNDRSFIYFRIPKAANSYILANLIYNDLYPKGDGDDIKLSEVDKLKEMKSTFHLMGVDDVKYAVDKYYKFTVVRDPYSRFVSVYLDKIARNKKQAAKVCRKLGCESGADIDVEAFIDYLEMEGSIYEDPHWALQSDLIPLPNHSLDYIARFEDLENGANIIVGEVFGQGKIKKMASEHATNASSLSDEILTTALRNRVYNLYREDFDRFGYEK